MQTNNHTHVFFFLTILLYNQILEARVLLPAVPIGWLCCLSQNANHEGEKGDFLSVATRGQIVKESLGPYMNLRFL